MCFHKRYSTTNAELAPHKSFFLLVAIFYFRTFFLHPLDIPSHFHDFFPHIIRIESHVYPLILDPKAKA